MRSPLRFNRTITFAASLAWFQLVAEKRRLAAALAGIAVAIIMMLMQLGLREALFDSAVLHYSRVRGDLVMISTQYTMLLQTGGFSRRRLYQAAGQEGVESVTPVYLSQAPWKNPQTLTERNILVIGFDPHSSPIDLPDVQASLSKIEIPDVVLFDQASRPEFGAVAQAFAQTGTVKTEAAGHQVEVGGIFTLGTSFGADGTILASDVTFQRMFPSREPGVIQLGVIRLKSGTNPEAVRTALQSSLSGDVKILTHAELIALEKHYWAVNTPIGFVITMTLIFGLCVGAVILYQILYTDVSDHLAEFATLKAMGHADKNLFLVVLFQAILLALLAYFPSWLITVGIYAITKQATHLPIAMTWERTGIVFLLTVVMCSISGFLAMQKLRSADPAEVF